MWSLANDHYVVAVLSQIFASIVGANFLLVLIFFYHSIVVIDYGHNVVTMSSLRDCYFIDFIFGFP